MKLFFLFFRNYLLYRNYWYIYTSLHEVKDFYLIQNLLCVYFRSIACKMLFVAQFPGRPPEWKNKHLANIWLTPRFWLTSCCGFVIFTRSPKECKFVNKTKTPNPAPAACFLFSFSHSTHGGVDWHTTHNSIYLDCS